MSGVTALAVDHSKPENRLDLHDKTGEVTRLFASGIGERVRHCDWA